MTLALKLWHGRNDPNADMDDWGYEGPTILFESLTVTYMAELRLHCMKDTKDGEQVAAQFGLTQRWDRHIVDVQVFEDMLCIGKFPGEPNPGPHYFGDWSICLAEDL